MIIQLNLYLSKSHFKKKIRVIRGVLHQLIGFEIYICKGILLTVLRKLKIPFLLTAIFMTALLVILIGTPYEQAFSQTPGGLVPSPQPQLESIKILNLVPFQSVDINKELVVSGESSDTTAKDCSAYVIVNGVQPYQSAVAIGKGGTADFSQWKFVLPEQYTHLNEGNNKITAKLVCSSAPTRWYSVVVNGVSSSNLTHNTEIDTTQQSNVTNAPIDTTSEAPIDTTHQSNVTNAPIDTTSEAPIDTTQSEAPIDTTQQSNVTNPPIDTTQSEAPIDTTQQSNVTNPPIDTTQSEAPIDTTQSEAPIDTTQQSNNSESSIDTSQQPKLHVAILPLKNPVARGDSQNATIIVTDEHNRTVANAQIDGKLIYPGNNFEKDFKGITDLDGKFAYSWIVGKKGDTGALIMEVEVSRQGYPPESANVSIELLKSGESSQIENPFQSLHRP